LLLLRRLNRFRVAVTRDGFAQLLRHVHRAAARLSQVVRDFSVPGALRFQLLAFCKVDVLLKQGRLEADLSGSPFPPGGFQLVPLLSKLFGLLRVRAAR
jgi:hypothetical protein